MAMDTILVFQSEPKLKISTGPFNEYPYINQNKNSKLVQDHLMNILTLSQSNLPSGF